MRTQIALLLLASGLAGCSPVSQAGAGAFLGGMMGVVAEEASYQQTRGAEVQQQIRDDLRHQELLTEQRRQTEALRQLQPPYQPSAPRTPLPSTCLYGCGR